jgi:hypothetical protein
MVHLDLSLSQQLQMEHQSSLCISGAMQESLREVRLVLQNFHSTHL